MSDEQQELSRLTAWLKVALGLLVIANIANDISSGLQIALLSGVQRGIEITQEAAEANDSRQHYVAIFHLAASLATAILFLRWTYVTKRNAVAMTSSKLAYSPGWSVGYYFIPFATLWIPYKALKEAFQASHPGFQQNLEWSRPPRLLGWWWALWLASGFVGQGILRATLNAKTVDQFVLVSWAELLASLIDLPLIAVVWVLVSTMLQWQTARMKGEDLVLSADTGSAA